MAGQGEIPEITKVLFGGGVEGLSRAGLKTVTVRLKKPRDNELGISGPVKDYYTGLKRGVPVAAVYSKLFEDGSKEITHGEIVPIIVTSGPIREVPLPMLLCDGYDSPEHCAQNLTDGYYGERYGTITVDNEVETIMFLSRERWEALDRDTQAALLKVDKPEAFFDLRFADVWKESLAFWMLDPREQRIVEAAMAVNDRSYDDRLDNGLRCAIDHCSLETWNGVVTINEPTQVGDFVET